MSLNLALSLFFSYLFTQIGWMPHGGLALANSLATALESIALLYLMRRKLQGLEGKTIWQGVLKALIASAAMAAGLLLWLHFAPFSSSILITLGRRRRRGSDLCRRFMAAENPGTAKWSGFY